MAENETKKLGLDDLSKAKLKVTLRNMNTVADMSPAVADAMKGVLGDARVSLRRATIDEAVEQTVESVELLRCDPAEFADDLAAGLLASITKRDEERKKAEADKAAAEKAAESAKK